MERVETEEMHGTVKGWTPDGREVELTAWQAGCVRALLARTPAELPARGYGAGWSTALHTAARYDAARRTGDPLPSDPGLTGTGYADNPGEFADAATLQIMRDRVDDPSVRRWYEMAAELPPGT